MCYPHCLACDKPMSSSEMGRRYESAPEEHIGLCSSCTLSAGIRSWTSSKIQENNRVHGYDEWYKKLEELVELDKDIHDGLDEED